MRLSLSWLFKLLLITLALAACAQPTPPPAIPTDTPIPSATPTPTYTATPTFTPTPTAQPLLVSGDLRSPLLTQPIAQAGAPCGIVDTLDFPLGPPDGVGYRGPGSFGVYRERYNGIHAGEDWGVESGNSLGRPVYSIGHGMVTYAQPLGWGIDRGVVIVRHVFPDGRTFLSFYGHLDPPSVVLQPGDCVARGEQVGAVGKPRGRPHLHFEIRTHTPDDPGPGYWPVDPRRAGWLIPSDTIWDYRIQISPGVAWMRPFTATNSAGLGWLNDGTLAAVDGDRLLALDPGDGALRWSRPISLTQHAVLDVTGRAIYVAGIAGTLQSIDASGEPRWTIDFGERGRTRLMPLPGGGVVTYFNGRLIGVSAAGEQRWQLDLAAPPAAWTLGDEQLLFTVEGDTPGLYALDQSGQIEQLASIGGRPILAGDRILIYHKTGVYQIDRAAGAARLIYPLDTSLFGAGDVVVLPDQSVMLSHRGLIDQRLIWIDAAGVLRWDRSVTNLGTRPPRLFLAGDEVYALSETGEVLHIDLTNGDAQRVLSVGNGSRLDGDPWALATTDDRLLVDFRGGQIVALDPRVAFEAVAGGE